MSENGSTAIDSGDVLKAAGAALAATGGDDTAGALAATAGALAATAGAVTAGFAIRSFSMAKTAAAPKIRPTTTSSPRVGNQDARAGTGARMIPTAPAWALAGSRTSLD